MGTGWRRAANAPRGQCGACVRRGKGVVIGWACPVVSQRRFALSALIATQILSGKNRSMANDATNTFTNGFGLFKRAVRYGTPADWTVDTEAKVPIISTLQGFVEEKLDVDRESRVGSYCRSANAIFGTASDSANGHNDFQMIAAGRHHRIPAGHDARRIASGDARRGDKRAGRAPDTAVRSERSTAVRIHAAALLEYVCVTVSRTGAQIRNSSGLGCL